MEHNQLAERAKVEIMGKVYTLKGDVDPEYMGTLAKYVDVKLKDLKALSADIDNTKLALLVALNLADELFQAKKKSDNLPDNFNPEVYTKLEEKTHRLINMIEKGIIGDQLH